MSSVMRIVEKGARIFAGMNGRVGKKGVKRRPLADTQYLRGDLSKGVHGYYPTVHPRNLPLFYSEEMEAYEITSNRLKRRGKGPPKKGAGNKKRKKR
eukprot:g4344.t1